MDRVNPTPADARDLAALYEEYGWWADRTVPELREALSNTLVAVGLRDEGELIAAARVVTDGVYYAKLYDVIVAADRRGEGIGTRLLAAVESHPDLRDVWLSVTCREGLTEFYERAGFETYPSPVDRPDGEPEEMYHLARPRGDGDS